MLINQTSCFEQLHHAGQGEQLHWAIPPTHVHETSFFYIQTYVFTYGKYTRRILHMEEITHDEECTWRRMHMKMLIH